MREIVGKARIVGVGESIHGIHEFLGLRQRMVEFLVEKMGFTAVALESGLPDSRMVYDYVLGGEKPARIWQDGFTWGFGTFSEYHDLIEWMRAYNRDPAHSRKIHFYGMDVVGANGSWVPALEQVLGYLDKVDPACAESIRDRLLPLVEKFARPGSSAAAFGAEGSAYAALPLDERNAIAAYVNQLADRFEGLGVVDYIAASSQEDYDWAHRIALNLAYANAMLTINSAPKDKGYSWWNGRDLAMARNVRWMREREGPEHGVVILAHNGHVQTAQSVGTGAAPNNATLGIFLASWVGDDYRNLGFTFNRGTMRDQTGKQITLDPADAESLDGAMARVGLPMFFLNLQLIPKGSPMAQWLDQPLTQRIQNFHTEYKELHSWDALIFLDKITPSHPPEKAERPGIADDEAKIIRGRCDR